MQWGALHNAWWLLALVMIIYLSYRVYQWRETVRKTFADAHLFEFVFPYSLPKKFGLKLILSCIALFFIILALMDPLAGTEEKEVSREGIDIVYVLDVSTSMDAEDIAPSRLLKASRVISESLNTLGGDRASLIVFAADSYTISPLTNDYAAIDTYLATISTKIISNQGTNFQVAFDEAVKVLKGAPNTSKMMVLLSDGEDNENTVTAAVRLAKENQIHVVSIGIGTEKGGPIPVETPYSSEYKLDRSGEVVVTTLESNNLNKLANQTNGMYLSDAPTNELVKQINDYKSRLDKTQIATSSTRDMKHIFQWFLGVAIVLLFIEILTTEYKNFNGKKR
ncbi:VWA domain-containing protein [Vaginella massiliensis]|uniref:VWA domain-containing protein n=1 Tax=Vaginella massiliensis TaxID=1816680 RepID=UPI000837F9C6|nr:VWA domain-containing protein [Vaginella massiliensis]